MRQETLLGLLRPLLETINNQNFRNPKHREQILRRHKSVTSALIGMGAGPQVMQLRYEVNTGTRKDHNKFVPTVIDSFPTANLAVVGWVPEDDGSFSPVTRELLGRTCDLTISGKNGNQVTVTEYYRPKGEQDDLLFRIAEIHNGLTGAEGVVIKEVHIEEAKKLQFTA